MALNVSYYQNRQAEIQTSGGKFLKLKNGKNTLRVFTFEHTVTEADYANGVFRKNDINAPKIGSVIEHLESHQRLHFQDKKSVPCEGPGCELCKEASRLMASSNKQEQELGKRLRAVDRYELNCVDTDNPDNGIQIATVPTSVFNRILDFLVCGEYEPEELFGVNGRDMIITRDSKATPDKMYQVMLRDGKKSAPLDEELIEDVQDLLNPEGNDEHPEDPLEDADEDLEDEVDEEEESDSDDDFVDDDDLSGQVIHFEFEGEVTQATIIGPADEEGMWLADGEDEMEYELSPDDFTVGPKPKPKAKKKSKKKVAKKVTGR